MPVTNDNKLHYLNSLAQYRLVSSCREEVEAFLKGLNLLIPDNLLSIFDENELEVYSHAPFLLENSILFAFGDCSSIQIVFTLRMPSCLLQLLMCGTGKYSVTDFKAHAVIDGTSYSFFKVKIYRPSS